MYEQYGERTYFLKALEVILIYNFTKSSPPHYRRNCTMGLENKPWITVQRQQDEPCSLLTKSQSPHLCSFNLLEKDLFLPPLPKHLSFFFPPIKMTLCLNKMLYSSCSSSKVKLNFCVNLHGRPGGSDQKWPPTMVARARLADKSKPHVGILMKWPNFHTPHPKHRMGSSSSCSGGSEHAGERISKGAASCRVLLEIWRLRFWWLNAKWDE